MAWIELHQTLPTHKKTLAAADLLDMAPVHFMGHLIAFWLWALDNVPDGDLRGISARMIARAAQWEGAADEFVNALEEVGYLELVDGALTIHDWADYAGKLISRRAAERERSNQRRNATKEQYDQRSTDGRPTDNHKEACGTVPYSTVPYTTKEDNDTCASDDALERPDSQPEQQVASDQGTKRGRAADQDPEADSGEQRATKPFKSLKQQQMFNEFWLAYPKKRSKGDAEKAWVKITPDDHLFGVIMQSLGRAMLSLKWVEEDGQFIPYPASWLNAKGWYDEYANGGRRPAGEIPRNPEQAAGASKYRSGRYADVVK